MHLGAHAKTLGLQVYQRLDALLHAAPHLRVQRTQADLQPRRRRNHVVGLPGMHRAHRHHRRLQRVHMARHNGLQRHHDGRRRHHHIGGLVRHGPMPAHAVQRHRGVVRRGHGRPTAKHQLALRNARHVVHGKNRIARKTLKQPVFHHLQRATAAFFGGLKNQVQRAVKHTALRQLLRRSQQHGGVAVVAAGVHHAVVATGPIGPRGFHNRQRVHVGPQTQAARRTAPAQLAYHTGATQVGAHRIAPAAQLVGHQRAGAVLVKSQFGVAVNVAPQGHKFLNRVIAETFQGRFSSGKGGRAGS